MKKLTYPFAAIVGQEELILGIILNMINPKLGGLLIKGVKGSGKSTAVYSMTDIMPDIEIFQGCCFNCDPDQNDNLCPKCTAEPGVRITKKVEIVPVPLSITEDRLLGNIDVELLLKEGKHRFIPGLLTKAHRQILYIDEVNLLPDHIVDDILDVSAMGWNHIEREGFSISHASRFLLIGTMNPEEGELRPQILDRFPLSVSVSSVENPLLRKEIINRNLAYEKNPLSLSEEFALETDNLKKLIILARKLLDNVIIDSRFLDIIVKLCADHKVDGHRADIAMIKTAKTHAAFELKDQVELRHIKQAAKFVLTHRTREGGLSKPLTLSEIEHYFADISSQKSDMKQDRENSLVNKNITLFAEGGLIRQEKKS